MKEHDGNCFDLPYSPKCYAVFRKLHSTLNVDWNEGLVQHFRNKYLLSFGCFRFLTAVGLLHLWRQYQRISFWQ